MDTLNNDLVDWFLISLPVDFPVQQSFEVLQDSLLYESTGSVEVYNYFITFVLLQREIGWGRP